MTQRMHDVVYGAEPLGPRVVAVSAQPEYKLLVSFDNGEKRMFDARPLLDTRPFAPLRSESFFYQVRVDHGTIAWPNDIDYCPDTLYQQSTPIH